MLLPLLQGLAELLAPSACAGCELPHSNGHDAFCEACLPLLERAPGTLAPPVRASAGFVFEGPLADAIRRFKYAGRTELANGLGCLLFEAALPFTGSIDVVMPVPLHASKLRERGYNPAALIAKPLAHGFGAKLDCWTLERVRATAVQAALPRAARATNVRGAFSVRKRSVPARVLLIDDVRTTGATLSAAAGSLTEAGFEVTTLALAWAAA